MKNNIPNFLTILNLIIGFYCIINIISGEAVSSILFLFYFCLILDYLDGFFARKLNIVSEFGKQIDSLADLVSFGVLPSTVMYFYFEKMYDIEYLKYLSFLILIFSVIRLAKFNTSENNNNFFEGLPTPANALFFISLANYDGIYFSLINQYLVIFSIVIFSFLMISNFKFMSLKFNGFDIKNNIEKYLLLSISFCLLITQGDSILFFIVFIYVFYSFSKTLISRLFLK